MAVSTALEPRIREARIEKKSPKRTLFDILSTLDSVHRRDFSGGGITSGRGRADCSPSDRCRRFLVIVRMSGFASGWNTDRSARPLVVVTVVVEIEAFDFVVVTVSPARGFISVVSAKIEKLFLLDVYLKKLFFTILAVKAREIV